LKINFESVFEGDHPLHFRASGLPIHLVSPQRAARGKVGGRFASKIGGGMLVMALGKATIAPQAGSQDIDRFSIAAASSRPNVNA
jgi:hypothetical protein